MDKSDLLKLVEIENRRGGEKVHLAYLKELYNSVEIVKELPNWENCFNIGIIDIDKNLEVVLHTASAYLQHHNKIAVKIAQCYDNEKQMDSLILKTKVIQNA